VSAPEQTYEEPRSRVKISETAKAEPRVEVSVYAGDSAEDVAQAQKLAQDTYLATVSWLKSVEMRAA
jgi:hypothetical protein